MNIRIRRHNDDPNLRVVELIVDNKVMDDIVCDSFRPAVIEAVTAIIHVHSHTIDYVEGLDDHELRKY